MPVIGWTETQFIAFILLLFRLSAFFVVWPVFFVTSVPFQVKVLLSLSVGIILFPLVNLTGVEQIAGNSLLIWYVIKEIFIGLVIGYMARFFFYIFNIAGDIISTSMGLSGVQLLNPNFGGRSSAIEQFLMIMATLFFISINGHHLLIMGIADSFRIAPIFNLTISMSGFESSIVLLKEITEMGIKICAPAMVSIFFMNLAMAIIGKAVPQFNVLITSLPINILLGFTVMLVSMPILLWQMDSFLEVTIGHVFKFVKTF